MSPHDDDDITTPARPTARPVSPPPPAAPPIVAAKAAAAPSTLKWGIVGSLHRIEPLAQVPGQTGVVRLLPNTVKYTRPPLDVTWSEVRAEPGRFEMAWPGNPTQVRTLEDIGAELRRLRASRGELPPGHATGKELDTAVNALLTTAEKLNRQGWSLGLLTPGGVMLNNTPNGVEAIPVDLGFTWTGEFGDPPWDHSPGRPEWLNPDSLDNPPAAAWGRPPVEQQFAQPTGSPFPKSTPTDDVRTLGRVIAWTLTGRPMRDIPAGDPESVLGVLHAASAGEIETPHELAERLHQTPPSRYFERKPEPIPLEEKVSRHIPPDRPRTWLKQNWPYLTGVAALLMAGVVFAYVMFGGKKDELVLATLPTETPTTTQDTGTTRPTNASPPTSLTPEANPPKRSLDDYRKLPPGNLPERMKKLREVAAAARKAGDPALNKEIAKERERLFADWLGAAEKAVTDASEAARRGEIGSQLRKLVDEYESFQKDYPLTDPHALEKEKQWLEEYNRQAELLGWPRSPSA